MSAAAGVGATKIIAPVWTLSSQFAQYLGVPCVSVGLNSEIKLVSLFSKNILVPPLITWTDLISNASEGNETYLFPAVNVEVAYFLKLS